MSMTYKQDLRDIAVAVAQQAKAYTDKKIEDFRWELGTYDLGVDTINGTTMLLPTPENTIQATMVEIDGKSEKCSNDWNFSNYSITDENVSHTLNGNNGITITNETANLNRIVVNHNLSGNYTFEITSNSANGRFVIVSLNISQDLVVGKNTIVVNNLTSSNPISLYCFANSTITLSNIIASTDYFSGIHNLELSGLKVEGANKFNSEIEIGSFNANTGEDLESTTRVRTKDFTTLSAGTYTISWNETLNIVMYVYDTNGNYLQNESTTAWSGNLAYRRITLSNARKVKFAWRYNTNAEILPSAISNIMLNEGSTALAYVPYITPTTKTIDLSTILYNGSPLFEGNSLKGVGTAKDYITPYKAHKQMAIVDLSTLNWIFDSNSARSWWYSSNLQNIAKKPADASTLSTILSNYENKTYNQLSADNTTLGALIKYDSGNLIIRTGDSQNSPTGYLVYELATPIEVSIDFSQLVKFEAYSNGSITLVNTNNQDTKSTFKYLKEVAK